jgi:hypothetical protein
MWYIFRGQVSMEFPVRRVIPFLLFRVSVPIEWTDCPHLLYPWLTSALGFTARHREVHPESGTPSCIPEGTLGRLPHTTPGLTFYSLDRYGLRGHTPTRPASTPHQWFVPLGSLVCSQLPSDDPSRGRPCGLLPLHLHPVGARPCLQAVGHARHT